MKIAIISRGYPTQDAPLNGIFEFDQAKALAALGHQVCYMAFDYRNIKAKRRWGFSTFVDSGVTVFLFSLPTGVYRRALCLQHLIVKKLFARVISTWGRPDILHAHFYFMAALAYPLKTKYQIPLVITEHSSKLNKPLSDISALDRRLVTLGYAHADKILCVSTAFAKQLETNFNVQAQVVGNICDLEQFAFKPHPKHHQESFTMLSVGRLIAGKGFEMLIQAFAKALKGQSARLLIIGDGPQKNQLEQLIHTLDLQNQVYLLGTKTREEIAKQMQMSDCFVLFSEKETFGVSYIEALAMGLPVLSTACGGVNDFISPNNGIVIPIGDEKAAIEALKTMQTHYHTYDNADIAMQIKARFAPITIAKQLVAIYNSILPK